MTDYTVILVCGGAGFIGSSLTEKLLSLDYSVTAVDNFNPYYNPHYKRENVQPFLQKLNYTLVEGDITDTEFLESVFQRKKFDIVIHLAASVGVRNSLQNPKLYQKNNVFGTENILKHVVKNNIPHFLFASSSSIYGNNSKSPFTENAVSVSDLNPYAETKKIGEELCQTYHTKYGIPLIVFRFFTVYGPKGRPDMSPYIFTESVLKGKEINIYGDGSAQRDFTYIDDLLNGIVASLQKKFSYEVFNLGSSSPIYLMDFIRIIEKISRKKAKLQFLPPVPSEMKFTFANIQKAQKLLDYQPQMNIEEGLERFIYWFKKHRV